MFIQFLLFQFLRIIVEAYYLQHFVTPSNTDDEGWLIKNPYNGASSRIYSCGVNTIFGGYQIFGCSTSKTSMMKYFMLPPHYKVRIDITFWKIDDWPNTQLFYIIIDQWTQSWYFTSNTGSNQCGGPGTDYGTSYYNDFPLHTLNSIIVELYSDCNNNNFWGLTNFQITLNECYQGCQFCLDSTVDCNLWKLWQSFFQLQNLDNGLEGWIRNKFPSFTYSTNDLQLNMLVLNQYNSAITYLTLPDHQSLIIQFRIEYLSVLPITVSIYINDEYKYGLISYQKYVDYRTWGPINLISCIDDNLVPFDGCFAKQKSCLEGCVFCVKGECLMCDTRWEYNSVNQICVPLCGDKYITANEECDDGNDLPFDGCHQCQFSCPLNCQNCIFGQCQVCNSGYYYSNRICYQIYENLLIQPITQVEFNYLVQTDIAQCGDGKVQQDEECDDGNNFPHDGCYNCYFQCILNCQQCSFGACQQCNPGYELINRKCLEIQKQFRSINCDKQDSILSEYFIQELSLFTYFDTSDTYFNDICNLERSRIKLNNQIFEFRCPLFCEKCEYGQCKKCLINHFLLKNQCISKITKGVLLFEDGIHTARLEIGCYKCNDSCQIQCLQCLNSQCLYCIDGWSLMNGICLQICGDNQIAIWSYEQCDTNLNDCFNCKFLCPENCQYCKNPQACLICDQPYVEINHQCQLTCIYGCKKCINGICYDNCSNGEMNIDGICYSICGDGIKQQKEQCDDGNKIQFDGCFNCEFSCPQYCENCFEGICIECQQYFKLIKNACYDDCGSGIKSYDEQCDDGNLVDVDGCTSNCKIEVDYKCQDKANSYSDCQYSESPQMLIKFLNQTYNKYYLQIVFSQAIQFRDNYVLESLFYFSIDELLYEDYQIKLESNYEPQL
ncbi:unnamed protein product [Paramecium pentaurelia]|uniref:Insulin-like growth factor binding protein, N-terminal n=1 Tax=Paramecium pentaurelia TaxID=43138 RepID=A0A8S1UYA6_9CILI|nr:unnamed protein product [Paramecium pentaurelia]